ncbi:MULTISPECIES: hypothetical protein [unclassified Burkholderia]|nr:MULTISPECIES: hypothetical protein [unclassified Burkholderia]
MEILYGKRPSRPIATGANDARLTASRVSGALLGIPFSFLSMPAR